MAVEGIMQYAGQGSWEDYLNSTPNYAPSPIAATSENEGASAISSGQGQKQGQQQEGKSSSKNSFEESFQKSLNDSVTLSPEAQQQVRELQQRDSEVRSHEQAHVAAGAGHVRGGIQYTYTQGPDNKQYASGGSVSIDTSPVSGDPEATIEKARAVRSAALAPGNPSAQDQAVAAEASTMEAEARTEKAQQQSSNSTENNILEKDLVEAAADQQEARQQDGLLEHAGKAEAQGHNDIYFASPHMYAGNGSFSPSSASFISNVNALHSVQGSSAIHNVHSTQPAQENISPAQRQKAEAAYGVQHASAIPSTSLAPLGTGISMQV